MYTEIVFSFSCRSSTPVVKGNNSNSVILLAMLKRDELKNRIFAKQSQANYYHTYMNVRKPFKCDLINDSTQIIAVSRMLKSFPQAHTFVRQFLVKYFFLCGPQNLCGRVGDRMIDSYFFHGPSSHVHHIHSSLQNTRFNFFDNTFGNSVNFLLFSNTFVHFFKKRKALSFL